MAKLTCKAISFKREVQIALGRFLAKRVVRDWGIDGGGPSFSEESCTATVVENFVDCVIR